MSSEFLEKIRKIIVILFVLFISILNTWIAFCSLPVYAAESTASNKKIVQDHFYKYDGESLYFKYIVMMIVLIFILNGKKLIFRQVISMQF